MTERDQVLLACLADPADAAPRLALADLLEEEGVLDPDESAVFRDSGGTWLTDTVGNVLWAFAESDRALDRIHQRDDGHPRFVYASPLKLVCLVVGRIPPGSEIECYSCRSKKDLAWEPSPSRCNHPEPLWWCHSCRNAPPPH